MSLFTPPEGAALLPFQEEGVIRAYMILSDPDGPGGVDVQYDMGMGKSNLSMAVAALLFEDGAIDRVLVVAEANKVRDWTEEDFPKWTSLTVGRYAGTPEQRARLREAMPQVLVMTYEMGRNDIARFAHAKKSQGRGIAGPGPLAEALKGQRVLIIFDECTKVRTRSSRVHLAWDYLLNRWLRRNGVGLSIGLTGTKIESSPEDHYNVNRILVPTLSPKVKDFEAAYGGERDPWSHKIKTWRNLDEASAEPGVVPLSRLYEPVMLRKRKTDPDVIGSFPDKVENPPRQISLAGPHGQFYADVVDALDDDNIMAGLTVLRQIAGHPMALTRSQGEVSKTIVEAVGVKTLERLGSAKTDAMMGWLAEAGDQQAVIFTFFGQSILPLLAQRLRDEGYGVEINHGQMDSLARQEAQNRFKAGEAQVFLSSDAGARGLNLGVGSVLLHYDLPLLYSVYAQRSDRIHRANSVHPSVTIDSLVAQGTVEHEVQALVLKRYGWSEQVLDDDGTDALLRRLWRTVKPREAAPAS